MVKKYLFRAFVELSNHSFQSALLKAFTSSKLSRMVIPSFIRYYNINMDEASKNVSDYQTLQQLFIRQLKEDVRMIHNEPSSVISPVDGQLAFIGTLDEQAQFFVKGQTYTLEEMLGSKEKARRYIDGQYMIFYLSPKDYHRFHFPFSGEISEQWVLGKKSYPVNELGTTYGVRPFSKNYRHITEMVVNEKHTAIIKVGALNVNSIHITHQNKTAKKGEELGYFSFGSTVILLFERGLMKMDTVSSVPRSVRMGEKIGSFV